MTLIRPLRKVLQALLLGLAMWVLAVGAASAHGAHSDERPVAAMKSHSAAHEGRTAPAIPPEAMEATEVPATHEGGTCPGGGAGDHSDGCCTIACHAAMAAAGMDQWTGPRISSPVPMLMSDLLEGRCGDRSERPPRYV